MEKKEIYRCRLPHFQQPGQWYFVTCALQGAIPKNAICKYSLKLQEAKNRLELHKTKCTATISTDPKNFNPELLRLQKEYRLSQIRYRLAYDYLLACSNQPGISLVHAENLLILKEAFQFWEGKKVISHSWCIMPNHFHWIVTTLAKDENQKPVYLQDILHSIKLFSSRRINQNEKLNGQLWMRESFETTIRDENNFFRILHYTLNNPVKAGFVSHWEDWKGTFCEKELKATLI